MSAFKDYKFDSEPILENDPAAIAVIAVVVVAAFISIMALVYLLLICLMSI